LELKDEQTKTERNLVNFLAFVNNPKKKRQTLKDKRIYNLVKNYSTFSSNIEYLKQLSVNVYSFTD